MDLLRRFSRLAREPHPWCNHSGSSEKDRSLPSLDGERNGPLTGLETAGHVGTKAGPWVFAGRVKPSLDYLDQIDINYRDHSRSGLVNNGE